MRSCESWRASHTGLCAPSPSRSLVVEWLVCTGTDDQC